ncbi:MAG: hypothetical protein JRF65_03535 [Deltaproteobacteria bacterium]|nr:hypothetical protein [Deltaproteobacteria bacterium]
MIYRMLISALMSSLKQACKITAWRSPDFRARLDRASFFMQVNISDDTRCYQLKKGRWRSSKSPAGSHPDLLIEWKSARAALQCLVHRDVANIIKFHMAALTEGRLSLEFNMPSLYRFGTLLSLMTEVWRPRQERGRGESRWQTNMT